MKKIISTLLVSGICLTGGYIAFAEDGTESNSQQTISGENSAEIDVNGSLGADNTDPETKIPEGDKNWINVTVPTKTIFYNTKKEALIKSPTYNITNHSGRPVKITATTFNQEGTVTLPSDFDLNLIVANKAPINLINKGSVITDVNKELITLSNSKNQLVSSDPASDTPTNNKTTFTYDGTATANERIDVGYKLGLKFDAIPWN